MITISRSYSRFIPPYLAFFLFFTTSCNKNSEGPPFEPADALKTFELPEGFRIELVASEPLITDPVEIAFDANGLLYVAEMEDYPAEAAPGGRIMLLEDKDHNGHFESGNVFAESLPYVNGVMPWGKGVLVTSAPDIIYFEDTTGDHRADIRQVVLTGFAFTNPQLRMSSLRYGLDNWIYGAYSRAAGQRGYPEFANHGSPLRFPGNPEKDSAEIYPGTDIRFRPHEFKVEPAGGMSQFGNTFDAKGNRFTVWNNIHLRHVVIDGKYHEGNPYFNISSAMANISDHGDAAEVFSKTKDRLDLHESEIGHFTSACGHSIYTGDLFGAPYQGAAFVCEPVSNLIHTDILKPNGATFSASRLRENAEFLTSADSWFRPVNTTVGPDGGLYVVDFYRKLVEHPAWIARADDKGMYTHAGMLRESDFLEGNDRGRIYRIVPEDFKYTHSEKPSLDTTDTEKLVGYLEHPNMWWRTTAQRLLVERQDRRAIPALKNLLNASPLSECRIHVLWTLEGLQQLDDILIANALSDEDASVRKQAVVLSESRMSNPAIARKLLTMTADADNAVLFQVALTLGSLPPQQSFEPLGKIALSRIADPWFRAAALLAAGQNPLDWFRKVRDYKVSTELCEHKQDFLQKITSIVGARQKRGEISMLVSMLAIEKDPDFQASSFSGLREGMAQAGASQKLSSSGQAGLLKLVNSPSPKVRENALAVAEKIYFQRTLAFSETLNNALKIVKEQRASVSDRSHAIRVLGLERGKFCTDIFDDLLAPKQPAEIQLAAAKVLIAREDTAALRLLVKRWDGFSPEVREIVETGFSNPATRLSFFMTALEKGELSPAAVGRTMRSRLTSHDNKDIRARAEKLLGNTSIEKREEVVRAYYKATTFKGDPAKGKTIFKNACSACHQMEGVGRHLGPDLLSITNQTRINLLTMILNPNQNISPGYDGYFVETTRGTTLTGILGNETSDAVVLKTPDGQEQRIPREQITSIRPMTNSLMPDGLETNLSVEDVADLLEYLKSSNR